MHAESGKDKMIDYEYVVLTATSEQGLANKTCEALEDAGIPVMLEHREIKSDGNRASGYRVLVPMQYTHTAQKLASAASSAFFLKASGMQ